jgi:hypothetical protein
VFVQSLPPRQIAELVFTKQFHVGVVELPFSKPANRHRSAGARAINGGDAGDASLGDQKIWSR